MTETTVAQITTETKYLDSVDAKRILDSNIENRPPKKLKIEQYYQDMVHGRWEFNGEAIKFGADGRLLDGQNRMMALARTEGISLKFLIIRGLEPTAQLTMDQGAKRSAADQLVIAGIDVDTTTAAAVRVILAWQGMTFFGNQASPTAKFTVAEVVQWCQSNPEGMDYLARATNHGWRRVKTRPALALAIAYMLSRVDAEWTEEFFTALLSGANLHDGDPILTLRDKLQRLRETSAKVPDRDVIAMFVQTWNAWRESRQLTKLQRPKGGTWTASSFPVPV